MLQEPKSCVPIFHRHIVFVIGNSTPRYRHKKHLDLVPVTKYDVIKHAAETDVFVRAVLRACVFVVVMLISCER